MAMARRGGNDLDDRPAPFPRRVALRQLAHGIRSTYNVGKALYNAYQGRKRNQRVQVSKSDPTAKGAKATGSSSAMGGQSMVMGKRKKRTTRKKKSLRKRVKALEKKTHENYAKHIYTGLANATLTASISRCGYAEAAFFGHSQIEDMLNSLPTPNLTTPATLQNSNFTTTTFPQKWRVKAWAKAIIRNNYNFPCDVVCYTIKPKTDNELTSIQSAVTSGLTLMANPSVTSTTSINLWPTHSEQFNDNFKIVAQCKMRMQSGDECVIPFSETFSYDQETHDANTSATYLKKYSRALFVRAVGVVCHDSTTSTIIGTTNVQLDILIQRKYTIWYPAIMTTRTIEDTTNLGTVTTPVIGVTSAESENAL